MTTLGRKYKIRFCSEVRKTSKEYKWYWLSFLLLYMVGTMIQGGNILLTVFSGLGLLIWCCCGAYLLISIDIFYRLWSSVFGWSEGFFGPYRQPSKFSQKKQHQKKALIKVFLFYSFPVLLLFLIPVVYFFYLVVNWALMLFK